MKASQRFVATDNASRTLEVIREGWTIEERQRRRELAQRRQELLLQLLTQSEPQAQLAAN